MAWGCFTASGVGSLVKIEGNMNGEMDRDILMNTLSGEYAETLPLAWIFQQENDPPFIFFIEISTGRERSLNFYLLIRLQ